MVWTGIDLFSYPLIMIAATPLFINKLGPEQYGLWMLINVIVQVMNGLNFGVGDSTIKVVAQHTAAGTATELNTLFNRNLSLSILLAVISAVLGYVAGFVIYHFSWFNIPAKYSESIVITVFLFSVSTGIKFIEQVFISVFKGLQRFDISARLMILSRLTTIIAVIAIVYLGYGIVEIIKISLLINLINLFIQGAVVYNFTPVKSVFPKLEMPPVSSLIKQNGWYWLQSVIALFGFLSDRLIIAYLTDLKTVGYYSIAALIGSQIHNILLAFGGFVFPKAASYTVLNKSINDVYYFSRFMIAVSGWFIIIFLLLAGDFVFKWWLGSEIYYQAIPYIRLYLAFISIIILIIIPFHITNGSVYLRFNTLFEIVLRLSHVGGMLAGYYFNGMIGLLWMLIATTLINIPFQYFLFHKKVLGISSFKESLIVVLPSLTILGIAFAAVHLNFIFVALFLILVFFIYYKPASSFLKNIIKQPID